MRRKRRLIIGAAAVAALILAAYLVLLSLDFNRFKPQIVQAVKEAAGLDVIIRGDIEIGFGLDLRVLLHDIGIRNASWGSRPDMIHIRRCELDLALLRLLRGVLEIEQLFFIEPDFLLERSPSGEFNFRIKPSNGVSSPPSASRSKELPLLPVKEVQVEKGRFTHRDGMTGEIFTKDVNHLVVSASDMQSPIHLELQGSLNERPVRVEGTFGSLSKLIDSDQPWPLDLTARLDGSIAVVLGTISDVSRMKGLSLEVKAEGPSISEALTPAGITLPANLGPFAFHAMVNDAEAGLSLKDIDLQAGTPETQEIKITGTISNILPLQGIQLDYQARCEDIDGLSGHSKSSLPLRGPLTIAGRVVDFAPNVFRFSPVRIALREQQLTGAVQLDMAQKLPRAEAVFTTSELNLGSVLPSDSRDSAWPRALQKMGAMALKLSVLDPYGKAVVEELDFRAGTDETVQIKVTGSVKEPRSLRGIQLFYEFRGKEAAELENLIGKPVPLKGPFNASGRFWDPSQDVLAFDPLEVSVGENRMIGMVELLLEGEAPLLKMKLSSRKLDLEPVLKPGSENPDLLGALSALGPITLAFTMSNLGAKPAVQDATAVLGAEDPAKVAIKGSIQDLLALQGIDLAFSLEGKDAAGLEKIFGGPIPLKGSFSLSGRARDPEPGLYRVEDLKAVLGRNEILGSVEARVSRDTLSIGAEFSSNLLDLEVVDPMEKARAEAFRDLGPWAMTARVASHEGTLSVESFQGGIGTRGLLEAKVAGAVHDLFAWQGVDLQCSLKGEDAAQLVKLAGKPLPRTGPFALSGRLIDPKAGFYEVKEFAARFGDTDVAGSFDLDLTEKTPRLNAEFSSRKLDLRPLLAESKTTGTEPGQEKTSPDKVFPNDPLPLENLHAMNAKAVIKADQILLPNLALEHVSADVTLRDGHLEMHPLQCSIGGGTVDGRLELRATGGEPAGALDLKAERIDIGAMLDALEIKKSFDGTLGAEIEVQSHGSSISALMAGMKGRIVAVVREGRIYNRYMDVLGGSFLREIVSLVNPFSEKEELSELNCAVHVFDIKDGVATCKTWLADTKHTILTGKGEIDLIDEELDLLFALSPKKGIGISGVEVGVSLPGVARSFKLGGTLAEPSLTINPGSAAGTLGKMVGGFTLLGPLGLAAGLLDVRVGEKDPCREALKALENGTYSPDTIEDQKTPPPNASEEHKGH